MTVIAISGMPGCGSTTVAKLVAEKLGLDFFSVGEYNKAMSKKLIREKHASKRTAEFWKYTQGGSAAFNRDEDAISRERARRGDVVIDAKLGVRMLRPYATVAVWLTAPFATRAKRYVKREGTSLAQAVSHLREKEQLERQSWQRIYGFDYFAQEQDAGLVIDAARLSAEQIADRIVAAVPRAFIIHRWEGRPKSDWYPFVAGELAKRGFVVRTLTMPTPDTPQMTAWVATLVKAVGQPSPKTIFIGHSAGVMTILRYLEQLKSGKIGGAVLVGGWTDDLGYKKLTNFFPRPIAWQAAKKRCPRFVVIHSDNDPYVPMKHAEILAQKLRATLVIEHAKGHLTEEEGITELRSVVRAAGEMVR